MDSIIPNTVGDETPDQFDYSSFWPRSTMDSIIPNTVGDETPDQFDYSSFWPRSTMDSIRVSEAPDPSSILGEATINLLHKKPY
jgi:hypothetical protein